VSLDPVPHIRPGDSRELATAPVRALALPVAADCIDHGEEIPEPFAKVFSVA
jgi:hypothetical protein